MNYYEEQTAKEIEERIARVQNDPESSREATFCSASAALYLEHARRTEEGRHLRTALDRVFEAELWREAQEKLTPDAPRVVDPDVMDTRIEHLQNQLRTIRERASAVRMQLLQAARADDSLLARTARAAALALEEAL